MNRLLSLHVTIANKNNIGPVCEASVVYFLSTLGKIYRLYKSFPKFLSHLKVPYFLDFLDPGLLTFSLALSLFLRLQKNEVHWRTRN